MIMNDKATQYLFAIFVSLHDVNTDAKVLMIEWGCRVDRDLEISDVVIEIITAGPAQPFLMTAVSQSEDKVGTGDQ